MSVDRYPSEHYCESTWRCQNPSHLKNDRGDCTLPEDDGTMPANVAELAEQVVGHRIVAADKGQARVVRYRRPDGTLRTEDVQGLIITLDTGKRVLMEDSSDCCAYTSLESFLLHPNLVDHAILGVGTTDGYQKWHIFADMGDVLELTVGWSPGNPFCYGYGFDIQVLPIDGEVIEDEQRAIGAGS